MGSPKCCVPNCNNVNSHKHSFPNPQKNLERFQTWMNKIQNSTLFTMDPLTVYKNKKVCHCHFETQFVSSRSQQLHANAIPTLFLSKPASESTITAVSDTLIQPRSDPLILNGPACSDIDQERSYSLMGIKTENDGDTGDKTTISEIPKAPVMKGYTRCAVFGCEDRHSPRHRFPNPEKYEELFNMWVKICDNAKLKRLEAMHIYYSYKVCHAHFTSQDISSDNSLEEGVSFPTVLLPAKTNGVHQSSSTLELHEGALPIIFYQRTYDECTSNKNTQISKLIKEQFETISIDDNQLLEASESNNEISLRDIPIIDFKDISKVCRTCMNSADIMVPILESVLQNEIKLVDLLLECASVQVNSSDCLPLNICNNCLDEILRIHIFRKQCTDVEQSLKELLLNAPKLEKSNDDDINFNCEQSESNFDEKLSQEVIIKDKTVIESNPKKIRKLIRKPRSNREYKCRDCEENFKMRIHLLAHLKETKHSELPYYKCELCHKSLKTKFGLKIHMRSHTKEKPYQCILCSTSFSIKRNLVRHMNDVHNGERPHVCEDCGKSFSQLVTLKSHKKTHTVTEKNGLTCKECNRIFKRDTYYLNHLKLHKKNEQETIITDTKEKETNLLICKICNKRYKSKNVLNFHLLTHSGKKSFLCSVCGKSFYTKASLNTHITVHTGEKPFTCTVCFKSFRQVGSLNVHMQIHSGFKPHQCHLCPKTFTQMQHLKSHMLIHNGIRQYTCNYCDKSFALKCNLNDHIRTHTREAFCSCPVCGKEFYCRSNFRKHKKSHEGEKKEVLTNEIVLAFEEENGNSNKSNNIEKIKSSENMLIN